MEQYKGFSKQLVLHLFETEGQTLDELVRRHGTEDPGLKQLEINELLEKDVLDHLTESQSPIACTISVVRNYYKAGMNLDITLIAPTERPYIRRTVHPAQSL